MPSQNPFAPKPIPKGLIFERLPRWLDTIVKSGHAHNLWHLDLGMQRKDFVVLLELICLPHHVEPCLYGPGRDPRIADFHGLYYVLDLWHSPRMNLRSFSAFDVSLNPGRKFFFGQVSFSEAQHHDDAG